MSEGDRNGRDDDLTRRGTTLSTWIDTVDRFVDQRCDETSYVTTGHVPA